MSAGILEAFVRVRLTYSERNGTFTGRVEGSEEEDEEGNGPDSVGARCAVRVLWDEEAKTSCKQSPSHCRS